ncbi:uncharacterized protein SAPINGB_P001718 [Magnusiomyces paraingens]|uniref:MADS-box domain-containing protein n=1 Tax=Magnusiomyces paraingens TaxID=2606893 RepID=A0A5E8BD57_9ASCO|nr:uncharacterized protein SAPINGB_P001718 [Saprochaete ingens]VVT47452.1 unnamed protein product [Saprochaete ingens]
MDPQDPQVAPQNAGEPGPDITSTLQEAPLGGPNQQISQVKRERLMEEDEDDEDERKSGRERRKIEIKFIPDKSRRHITFSKRKAGIMKKAYELSVLTGTQVLLLVVSETGLVYTFTTPKLQPLVTEPEGKNLIQACLNAPETRPNGHDMNVPITDPAFDPNQQAQQQAQQDAVAAVQRQQQEHLQAQAHAHAQSQQQPQSQQPSPSTLGNQVPQHLGSPGMSNQGLPRTSMPQAPVPLQHGLGNYLPDQQFSYMPPIQAPPQQQRYMNPHQNPSPGN